MANDLQLLNELYSGNRSNDIDTSSPNKIVLTKDLTLVQQPGPSLRPQFDILLKHGNITHIVGQVDLNGKTASFLRLLRGGGYCGQIYGIDLNTELGRAKVAVKILELLLQDASEDISER